MVYSGTLVTFGQATGRDRHRVCNRARPNRRLLQMVELRDTPLTRRLDDFARQLTIVILLLAAALWPSALWSAATRSHGDVPGRGWHGRGGDPRGPAGHHHHRPGRRCPADGPAQRHRPPPARGRDAGLGPVICSDKTGTLTRNEMTVRSVAMASADIASTAPATPPSGSSKDGAPVTAASATLLDARPAGLLCNDAGSASEARPRAGKSPATPPKGRCSRLRAEAGPRRATRTKRPSPRHGPFRSKSDASAWRRCIVSATRAGRCLVRGTRAGACLRSCNMPTGGSRHDGAWDSEARPTAPASAAARARARRSAGRRGSAARRGDDAEGLTFLGLLGMIDPPRPEASEASACHDAGITVKMITGDHAVTARAIAARDRPLGAGER